MAVALLARRPEALTEVAQSLRSSLPDGAVIETFPTDTSPDSLKKAFADIKQHKAFHNLKLQTAIFSVKHSSKKPFLNETYDDFQASMETYVGGAFTFSQESIKRFFADHGEDALEDGAQKKGTLIFTGTLGESLCHCHGYRQTDKRRRSQMQCRIRGVRSRTCICPTAGTDPCSGNVRQGHSRGTYNREWQYQRRGRRRAEDRQEDVCRVGGQDVSLLDKPDSRSLDS